MEERLHRGSRRRVARNGHLVQSSGAGHSLHVWRRSRTNDGLPELAELVVLARGIGRILMAIDAKLEVIVEHIGEEDDGDSADE